MIPSNPLRQHFRSRLWGRPTPLSAPVDVIRWWEWRRILYNLVVGATGLMTSAVALGVGWFSEQRWGEPIGIPDPPIIAVAAVVLYGLTANICYTGGWIAELGVRRFWGDRFPGWGPVTFVVGLVFSVLLTVAPAVLLIGILGIRLTWE